MSNRGESQEIRPRVNEIRFTLQGKILLVAVAFLYAQAYALNNLSPAILATILFAYVAFSRLSFDDQIRETRLAIRRHAKDRAFHDRSFPAQLEIHNGSGQAVWLKARDILPEEVRLASQRAEMLEVIEPGNSGKMDYMLTPLTRARLLLDRVKLTLMDERGLMAVHQDASSPKEIVVQSPLGAFHTGELLHRREYLAVAGVAPVPRLGRGYEFGGIRQYVPEDASVTIEWKSSSRLAKLMTKLMHEETRSSVYIFLDCSRSMRVTSSRSRKSKLDTSLEVAVNLATQLTRQGNPVGLGMYDEHRMLGFEPPTTTRMKPAQLLATISAVPGSIVSRSRRGSIRITGQEGGEEGFLARILPFLGRRSAATSRTATGIYHAVERLLKDRIKSGIIIVFSDLEANPNSILLSARLMLKHGHRPIIITPFAPAPGLKREEFTVEILEELYLAYQEKVSLMRKLERMGAQVIEVEEGREAAMKVSQRLSGRG